MNTFVKNEEGMGHGKYNSSHFYQSYKKNSPKKKLFKCLAELKIVWIQTTDLSKNGKILRSGMGYWRDNK